MQLFHVLGYNYFLKQVKSKFKLRTDEVRILIFLSTQDLPSTVAAIRRGIYSNPNPIYNNLTKEPLDMLIEKGLIQEFYNYTPYPIFSITKRGWDMMVNLQAIMTSVINEKAFDSPRTSPNRHTAEYYALDTNKDETTIPSQQ